MTWTDNLHSPKRPDYDNQQMFCFPETRLFKHSCYLFIPVRGKVKWVKKNRSSEKSHKNPRANIVASNFV